MSLLPTNHLSCLTALLSVGVSETYLSLYLTQAEETRVSDERTMTGKETGRNKQIDGKN